VDGNSNSNSNGNNRFCFRAGFAQKSRERANGREGEEKE